MKQNFYFLKLFPIILSIFVIQLIVGGAVVLNIGENQIKTSLSQKIDRIIQDLKYNNGNWNIRSYNNDPELLGTEPLYILTIDGFILDRRSPIKGFLDSSDFKHLLDYQRIQTLTSITGGTRRILSKVIQNKGQETGVITVSYFDPKPEIMKTIDSDLKKNVDLIASKIGVKNDSIDVSKIDEREISYDISFIVVDKFNIVLAKTTNVNSIGRIPNIIDPSYVKHQLAAPRFQNVRDSQTKKDFIVQTRPMTGPNNNIIGIIVVAESSEMLNSLLINYLLLYGIASFLILLGGYYLIYVIFKNGSAFNSYSKEPEKIWFDDKQCTLNVDQISIEIPYSTNQYYLLQALFSNPVKRWETDELLDRFGEIKYTKTRKIYDAMVNINKRVIGYVQDKLIINQNKTYQLNQKLNIVKSSK